MVTEGSDEGIREEYADILSGVGKLKNYQLKLHINKDVKPVAQQARRLPFGLRDKVDQKLDELLRYYREFQTLLLHEYHRWW